MKIQKQPERSNPEIFIRKFDGSAFSFVLLLVGTRVQQRISLSSAAAHLNKKSNEKKTKTCKTKEKAFFSACVSLNSRPVGDTMARSEGAVHGVSLRTNFDKQSVSASWQGPSVCLRMWQLVHPISYMMALTIKTQQEFVVVQSLHICLLHFTCQLFSCHCKKTVASLMDHKYGVMCGTLPIPIHLLAPLPNICPIKSHVWGWELS